MKLLLRFLGRGSAFRTNNNCAFFALGSELILLDCPLSAFHRLRHIGADKLTGGKTDKIIVLVTHTHSDHTSGIGMLIHYCYFMLHIPVEVIAPSDEVAQDLRLLTERIDGCDTDGFEIKTFEKGLYSWLTAAVATTHSEQLDGRCFGWVLDVDGQRIVYTGDTNTLKPFLPYLESTSLLYAEVSAYDSPVHLYIEKFAPQFGELVNKGIKVFFMHLDDEKILVQAAQQTGAQLAPLYENK